MIEKLFISYVHGVLSEVGFDFFDNRSNDKKNVLKDSHFLISPDAISRLSSIEMIKDFNDALMFLSKKKKFLNEEILFLNIFRDFFTVRVIPFFDKISVKFFIAKREEKIDLLLKVFARNDLFYKQLREFFLYASYEEVQDLCSVIYKGTSDKCSMINIQSARECPPYIKVEIREYFRDSYFVIFQVNTRLLGGMLVYKDAKIMDSSWLGKLNKIKSLAI